MFENTVIWQVRFLVNKVQLIIQKIITFWKSFFLYKYLDFYMNVHIVNKSIFISGYLNFFPFCTNFRIFLKQLSLYTINKSLSKRELQDFQTQKFCALILSILAYVFSVLVYIKKAYKKNWFLRKKNVNFKNRFFLIRDVF